MKEIKVANLTKGGNKVNIEKRWDNLPIPQRIEIAKEAGVAGRFGSSAWADLHEKDKEAILKLYTPKECDHTYRHKGYADGPATCPICGAPNVEQPIERPEGEPGIFTLPEDQVVQDYLLWVGWGSYPTIKSLVAEANRMGVSRRISKIPKDLVLGKSKIFLAHDEGETGDAVIFGYFIPTGIEMIVFDSTTINGLGLRKEITPVTLEQASAEDERGCGMRADVGSIYLVSYASEETIRQIAESDIEKDTQLKGAIVVLKPPKDYNAIIDTDGRRFRGIKKVDGQKILSGKTKSAPSIRHRVSMKMPRKKGDKWSEGETELLRKLTSEMRPRRAFREMMKITGRSLPTMEWHYRKIRESEKK